MDHSDTLTGTTLGGRYLLCGELAAGGMAKVHLARQLGAAGFSRVVAVKHPHEAYARHPGFLAMFLDEARLVARIRHPNVVQTLDVVTEGTELFLVMEYVHGESLLALSRECTKAGSQVPVGIAVSVVAGVLHGLHAAHDARSEAGEPLGIVHRDATPHNVMVGIDGVARVLDFGVAKAAERIQHTQDGKLKGKFSYMAPEQIRGEPVDRRTDVYAAAVMLWETLTGSSLFRRANEGATLHAVLHDAVCPPSFFNRAVPHHLDALVLRGLDREPGARFATAQDMAMALEATELGANATTVGAWVREVGRASLEARASFIADVESRSSGGGMRAAVESLREITSSSSQRAAAASVAPPLERAGIERHRARKGGTGSKAAWIGVAVVLGVGGGVALVRTRLPAEHPDAVAQRTESSTLAAPTLDAAVFAVAPPGCPKGMVRIEAGRFFMGSDDDLEAERPAHHVSLNAYCMDTTEVTAAAYKACSDRGDCKRAPKQNDWPGIERQDHRTYDGVCTGDDVERADHPINCIDWTLAERFCNAEGKRLPSEAEWEHAARGSDGRRYPWGDDDPSELHLNACGPECAAWGKKHGATLDPMYTKADAFPTTAPVGSFPRGASGSGVHDVVGNVWEWTADFYGPYTASDQTEPTGPTVGKTRVMRGGAWNGAYPAWVRPSFRFHALPTLRSHGVGFRCAKDA